MRDHPHQGSQTSTRTQVGISKLSGKYLASILMPTSPRAVQEIDIEPYRVDATRVMRGFFAIAFGPLYLLVMTLLPVFDDLPSFDLEPLKEPLTWITVAFAAAGLAILKRYSGTYDASALRAMLAGAWALTTLTVAFVLVKISEHDVWDFDERSALLLTVLGILALAGIGIMLVWLVLTPSLAALRLLSARLPGSKRALTEAIKQVEAREKSGARAPRDKQPNIKSRALKALGVSVALAGTAAVVWFYAQERMVTALAFEFATIFLASFVWRYAHRFEALDARTLLSLDPRPPILFLRSFQDDTKPMEQSLDMIGRVPFLGKWKAGRSSRTLTGIRLEETLAQAVKPLGPFVGIGAPGETVPELGAARAYFSNAAWQGAIVGWVDAAQLIVKIAGPTRWIRWELDTIIHRNAWQRLLILIPEGSSDDDRAARWSNIAAELDDTPWRDAFAQIDQSRVVAIRLVDGGVLSVVTSSSRMVMDYMLATRIMLHQMQGP